MCDLGVPFTFFQRCIIIVLSCTIDFLLRAGDLVEKLKFFARLPHTQIAAIICTDQVCNTLLRKRSYISCTIYIK